MPLDPDAVNMAKAIRQAESGGDFTAKGASGEHGAYQFTEPTWDKYASQAGVSVKLKDSTPEQQNEVAYKSIKAMKDQGLNPGQIASVWNSGNPEAYKNNHVGVNKYGVKYDTPAYATKVATYYQQLKSDPNAAAPVTPSTVGQEQHGETSRFQQGQKAIEDAQTGKINPVSGALQVAGAAGGFVGDVANNALKLIPGVSKVEDAIGSAVSQNPTVQQGAKMYGQFKEKNPEIAGDIGALANIGGAATLFTGGGLAKEAAGNMLGRDVAKESLAPIVEAVSPSLTPKASAKALLQRGTVQKGVLRETQIAPDPKMQELAQIVRDNVKGFDPSNLAKSVKSTQDVVNSLKESLTVDVAREGAGKIYPAKELIARLRAIERPDLIAADTTLNNVYDRLVNRVAEIAKSQGGKVEGLPEILGEFDATVKRQFPNLYKAENLTPMRQAVKDIREEIKSFAEEKMPTVELKDRMLTMHKLITAMENMAVKATKGSTKEIGSNMLTRFAGKFPKTSGAIGTGLKMGAEGLGLGGMLHMLGQ